MSIHQLSRLLPLPDDELKQVLSYAETLSKEASVEHFQNLLGNSPEVSAFISSFNSRRKTPGPSGSSSGSTARPQPSQSNAQLRAGGPANVLNVEPVPKSASKNKGKKKKADIHVPQARKVDSVGPATGTAYNKKNQTFEYISSSKKPAFGGLGESASATSATSGIAPDVLSFMEAISGPSSKGGSSSSTRTPTPAPKTEKPQKQSSKVGGYLIGDGPPKKAKSTLAKPTPIVSTKVKITGGLPMGGASAAVSDLDAAIRALEISTNPTLNPSTKARKCNCVATRHPLQSAAPNCMKCGKVICIKEGLGPCSYCGTPLLQPFEIQAILKELTAERGRERMAVDREAHKRTELKAMPSSYAQARGGIMSDSLLLARQHRDRLLNFQSENAQRTRIVDEAADFDVGLAQGHLGGAMWSSPLGRAMELKRQQKLLRELEWDAKPEYEKRRQVVSIDLVGGKVVKKMAAVERPATPESDGDDVDDEYGVLDAIGGSGGDSSAASTGKFSRNPLMGGLIRPVFTPGKGKEAETVRTRVTKWRRVQDDRDDNEAVILDGGIYGHAEANREEPAVCG
ncbi:putative protein C1A6.01c [Ceratocystis platani]|uniref:TRIP4/RQT4 C2HC5-type zinc finger domain-containing protein n=1 Tax=Ceratocystis fimbriata f. sp. platani TaxID=88771 RepID=A0A0F8BL41_CERFI|nr:putative protein C1A6.01c [Ceratocystis platani]